MPELLLCSASSRVSRRIANNGLLRTSAQSALYIYQSRMHVNFEVAEEELVSVFSVFPGVMWLSLLMFDREVIRERWEAKFCLVLYFWSRNTQLRVLYTFHLYSIIVMVRLFWAMRDGLFVHSFFVFFLQLP